MSTLRRVSVAGIRGRFNKFNRRYFDSKLTLPEIRVVPGGMKGLVINPCSDWAGVDKIDGRWVMEFHAITNPLGAEFLNRLVIHEMMHLNIGLAHDHASKAWRNEVKRVSLLGALKEVI